jgi:outer membrane protein assembly factor BamE (lipoprotein component of BamABCDE complex)
MASLGGRGRGGPARPGSRLALLAVLGLVAGAAACTSQISNHGHRLDAAALAQIEPGQSSQQDVIQLLGSPSSLATFDDRTWYYVSQRTESHTFYYRTVVAQDVVAIAFDDQGVVSRINRHDLNGAREIDVVDRETPTAGNELSVLEQFLGNIGRFNPPAEDE